MGNRIDGGAVRLKISLRRILITRTLAQHIIRHAISLSLPHTGMRYSVLNRRAEDKLLAHHLHCFNHGLANNRLTQTRKRAIQCFARQGHTDACGFGHPVFGTTTLFLQPICCDDLIFNQSIRGFCIRDTQKSLRQTHHRQPLIRVERKFL